MGHWELLGRRGRRGQSAYEIWLSQGNIGNEQQFVGALTAGIPNVQVFNTPGTYSWTVPENVHRIMVELWGGGGGGGFSSGGQGGGYGKQVIEVTPGFIYTVIVGNGGNSHESGGNSSFGNIISFGGSDGTNNSSSNTGSSNALIARTGSYGDPSNWNNTNEHGMGGESPLGGLKCGSCSGGNFPGGGGGSINQWGGVSCNAPGGHGQIIVYY